MANATDHQVQQYVVNRVVPGCERARDLVLDYEDNVATIDDVYNALNAESPTWSDSRTDGPPHLLTASDVLAFNTFMRDVSAYIKAHGQYAVVLKACRQLLSP
jgi:hypothetical protein